MRKRNLFLVFMGVMFFVGMVPSAIAVTGSATTYDPFSSWMNVKTTFGAIGDGVTDDTAALQAGITALGSQGGVLYLPAGTYKITSKLNIYRKFGVSIQGAGKGITVIKWAGPADQTMITANGVRYSYFRDFTLDGSSSALRGIDQTWD